jgi:hypothetical protein
LFLKKNNLTAKEAATRKSIIRPTVEMARDFSITPPLVDYTSVKVKNTD